MANRELDWEIRKDRLKSWLPVMLLIFVIIFVFAYVKFPPTGATSHVSGTVVGIRNIEGDGVRHYLVVDLDYGSEVLVNVPDVTIHYQKGRRISLMKKNSGWLGLNGAKYFYGNYLKEET